MRTSAGLTGPQHSQVVSRAPGPLTRRVRAIPGVLAQTTPKRRATLASLRLVGFRAAFGRGVEVPQRAVTLRAAGSHVGSSKALCT